MVKRTVQLSVSVITDQLHYQESKKLLFRLANSLSSLRHPYYSMLATYCYMNDIRFILKTGKSPKENEYYQTFGTAFETILFKGSHP